jgi:hypothetical protein
MNRINASIERVRIKTSAESVAAEATERAAFRATLMTELAAMRQLLKECESNRDLLRERLNTAEGQIVILKASNEIMERWVAFFKDRAAPQSRQNLTETKLPGGR